jgi:hypothetical protein
MEIRPLPEPWSSARSRVDIATGQQTATAVPLSAIISRNGSKGVLVADKGLARFQKISTGLQDGNKIAVLEGLKEGELVVINPAGIEPGKQIRPEARAAGKRD